MQHWRLRLLLHQVLTSWGGYVRRQRQQTSLYRPITDALIMKSSKRLLQLAFAIWEQHYARGQAQRMLVRVVDRHLYKKVCERAWRKWKIKVHQLAQIDIFHQRYLDHRLRRIWNAWSVRTREKEHREQQRRRAVRHYYLSLLRHGLNGFRAWRAHGQLKLSRVQAMLDAADARSILSAFSRWDHFTSKRKLQALKCDRALLHSQSQLVKRVWREGFMIFFAKAQSKKKKITAANEQYYTRTVTRCFHVWKDLWRNHRNHGETLNNMLGAYLLTKKRAVQAGAFEAWLEFTRAQAAARVVNAQVRGHHRQKTRQALVHWKLTLERRAFDGWKQYLQDRKAKQKRVHEALEFRHEQFVRDGLRHWLTAAIHLQEQREQRVTIVQASSTMAVWRRVAAIARHWRYLVIRHNALRDQDTLLRTRRGMPRHLGDVYWNRGHSPDIPAVSIPRQDGDSLRNVNILSTGEERSNWTNKRSTLSGFVLLPRNRPQPRKPVDVMLFAETKMKGFSGEKENPKTHEAFRYGFDFPSERLVPPQSPPETQADLPRPPVRLSSEPMAVENRRKCRDIPSREPGDVLIPSSTAGQLDTLERQLLALSQRKLEWKAFQKQLDELRRDVDTNPRLLSTLQSMEKQDVARTKQWARTKERIRSLATEIRHLRSALQR
ncbi:unnamed protein product [Phytophthora fragariaefolia]|uniref:Unnamed protein product n=1 Tax=Phytophthora fragariaefolia TaxID=1490495 RepID=A0A9W6U543_9STRA|nr:unnamed protein product [Phytophthora fragariaefolia]